MNGTIIEPVNQLDRIRNEKNRGIARWEKKKVLQSSLKLHLHVLRRQEECVGMRVMVIEVPWKRRIGSPKRKLLDNTRNHLSER